MDKPLIEDRCYLISAREDKLIVTDATEIFEIRGLLSYSFRASHVLVVGTRDDSHDAKTYDVRHTSLYDLVNILKEWDIPSV